MLVLAAAVRGLSEGPPAAGGELSETRARAAAVVAVSQTGSNAVPPSAWTVTHARRVADHGAVYSSSGNLIYTESGSGPLCFNGYGLCAGGHLWVIEMTAPGQGQFTTYEAVAIIDAATGRVRATSVIGHA